MEMSLYLSNVRRATEDPEEAILEFVRGHLSFSVYGGGQIAILYTSLLFILDHIW